MEWILDEILGWIFIASIIIGGWQLITATSSYKMYREEVVPEVKELCKSYTILRLLFAISLFLLASIIQQ